MGLRADILNAVKTRIETVTIANGYSLDVKTVTFETIRLNIHEYKDYELPAVQIIDTSGIYGPEFSRSKTNWNFVTEICLRTTQTLGVVNQVTLLDFMENVMRAVMVTPQLGISNVVNLIPFDHQTDLHTLEPNYIAIIGWVVEFYEPLTRENC